MISVYPGSIQKPAMRYHNTLSPTRVEEAMKSYEWVMQQKFDGAWYQLEKTDDGQVYLFGRTVSKVNGNLTEKIDNVPHIRQWAEEFLPCGTTVIGEIYIDGGHSNDVTKIMGCLPKKAVERQEKEGYVKYKLFDCIRFDGEDLCRMPFSKRYEYLHGIFWKPVTRSMDGIPVLPFPHEHTLVQLVKCYSTHRSLTDNNECFTFCEDYDEELFNIFASGGEGVVFKHLYGTYEPDKRPMTCFKIKEHIDSIDLVVMDLLEPTRAYSGKEIESWPYWIDEEPVTKPYYYGWKSGLRLGAYKDGKLVEVCRVSSGITDRMMEEMSADYDCGISYVGLVAEVECMSLGNGTLRHPVFKRIRFDKDASECIYDEIFTR